jgi:hypothetical protein
MPQSLSGKKGYMITEYLVQCEGKLLMVKRFFLSMARLASDDFLEHTVAFVVYEADLLTNPGRWRRAGDLGGHALFIGQHSSKSLSSCVTIIVLQIIFLTLVCTILGMTQWRHWCQGLLQHRHIMLDNGVQHGSSLLKLCDHSLWSTQLGAAHMYPSDMVPCYRQIIKS